MSAHSSILAWKIPQTEEPGGLQSMGSQGVGHDRATEHIHTITWYTPCFYSKSTLPTNLFVFIGDIFIFHIFRPSFFKYMTSFLIVFFLHIGHLDIFLALL